MYHNDVASHAAKRSMANQDTSKEDKREKRYLTYGPSENRPGFMHLWANICAVCTESLYHKRIPVLSSKLSLPKKHNPRRSEQWSSWSRYWDISELNAYTYKVVNSFFYQHIKVKEQLTLPILWVDDIEKWLANKEHRIINQESAKEIKNEIIQASILYRKPYNLMWANTTTGRISVRDRIRTFRLAIKPVRHMTFIHAKPAPEIWAVVDDIVGQLGTDFWAIHIRRNDVLTNRSYIHSIYASNIPWIVTNLECANLNKDFPVFLMTDERDTSYLLPLQKRFNIIRANDFKSYQNLIAKYPGDNFLCFHIERLIYLHAKRRYKTVAYWGETFEFMPFPEPRLEKVNYLPPHYPLPINCRGKYFSYLALERKHRPLNKRDSFLPLRYSLAQSLLRLRLRLSQQPIEDIEKRREQE